jgi:hypothetical protein
MFVCVSSLQHKASRPREKSPAKPGSMTSGMSNTDPAARPVILPHMRGRPQATSQGEALNGRSAKATGRGDAYGISDGLIRFSIGLQALSDIESDILQALGTAGA